MFTVYRTAGGGRAIVGGAFSTEEVEEESKPGAEGG
jgi:hypothetical protein